MSILSKLILGSLPLCTLDQRKVGIMVYLLFLLQYLEVYTPQINNIYNQINSLLLFACPQVWLLLMLSLVVVDTHDL